MEKTLNQKLNILKASGDAKIHKARIGNRRGEQTVITIDGKNYQYNPNKPLSQIVSKVINKKAKTTEYKKQEQLIKATHGLRLRRSLASYAIKNHRATVEEGQSALGGYTNSLTISNIKLLGLKGLSYIKYQLDTLKTFLNNHGNMKIHLVVDIATKSLNDDNERYIKSMRSRTEIIHNQDELRDKINKMLPEDIHQRIDTIDFSKIKFIITWNN